MRGDLHKPCWETSANHPTVPSLAHTQSPHTCSLLGIALSQSHWYVSARLFANKVVHARITEFGLKPGLLGICVGILFNELYQSVFLLFLKLFLFGCCGTELCMYVCTYIYIYIYHMHTQQVCPTRSVYAKQSQNLYMQVSTLGSITRNLSAVNDRSLDRNKCASAQPSLDKQPSIKSRSAMSANKLGQPESNKQTNKEAGSTQRFCFHPGPCLL